MGGGEVGHLPPQKVNSLIGEAPLNIERHICIQKWLPFTLQVVSLLG